MLQLLTYIRWCDGILDGEFGASCRSQMPFAKHMLSGGWYYGLMKYHSDSFGQIIHILSIRPGVFTVMHIQPGHPLQNFRNTQIRSQTVCERSPESDNSLILLL